MFKYIKWELKSLSKKYTTALIVIGVILGLMLIIPLNSDNIFTSLIGFAYTLLYIILGFGTFVFGTKKVIDTFRKPTFMLESMISFPPYKILLAKYLLAIILNIVCAVLLVLCLAVLFVRADALSSFFQIFAELLKFTNFVDMLPIFITLVISSISFTSLVTFSYVLSKSLFPKGKGAVLFSVVVWYFLTGFTNGLIVAIAGEEASLMVINLFYIIFIAIFYFITVKLIEDKLEIYN